MLWLSHSAIESFARCPKLFEIKYIDRARPEGRPSYFALGTATHEAVQCLLRGGDLQSALKAGTDSLTTDAADVMELGTISEVIQNLALMVTCYNEMWLQSELRLTRVEIPFKHALCPDWGIRGFADGLTLDGDLYELKTTSQSIKAVTAMLRHGMQVPLYQYLWKRETGEEAAMIIDIVKKPKLKSRKGESLEDFTTRRMEEYRENYSTGVYFTREQLPYDQRRIDDAIDVARRVYHAIRTFNGIGYPAVIGHNCNTCTGPCEAKRLCWDGDKSGWLFEK